MPEHTSWITYVLAWFPAVRENAKNLGRTWVGGHPLEYRGFEPIVTGLLVIVLFVAVAARLRPRYRKLNESIIPDDTLTLRTFFEAFFGYFYGMAKDVMGPANAKRYFPVIGGSAAFIFFSNALALIPGFNPPTSNLNVTLGCALLVFVLFNYFGFRESGLGYLKHFAGPNPILAPLIFPIEIFSTCVRVATLSIRLMLNMAVDHLLYVIFLGLVALLVPIPLALLGLVVVTVQTLVFCLLTSIYIGLATVHEEHH